MHEALFTRGDIQGRDDLAWLLAVPENCVLVHPGGSASPCHSGAQTKAGQFIVIKHLIKWEGLYHLQAYVRTMNQFMKGNQAAEANSKILEAYHEMQSM